ncbi:hypothetical protein LCGC14_2082680, partial [marine sediment metagenome]
MEGSGIVSPEGVEYESTQDSPDEPKDKTIGGRKVTQSREDAKPGDVDELGVPWFYASDQKPEKFADKPIPRDIRKKYRRQVRSQMKQRERELDSTVTRREYLAMIETQIEPLFDRMKRIEFSFMALKNLLRDNDYFTEEDFLGSVEKEVIRQRIEAVRVKAIDEGLDPDEVENAINQARREATTRYDLKKAGCVVELDAANGDIKLTAADDMALKSLVDIVKAKLVHRGVDIKAFHLGKAQDAARGERSQAGDFVQGISKDIARDINKLLKQE